MSTLKVKIFESQIILKSLGARKPKGINRIANIILIVLFHKGRFLDKFVLFCSTIPISRYHTLLHVYNLKDMFEK